MGRETEWVLFLDESGSFANDPAVFLGGVLVQERDDPDLARVIRERIRSVDPTVRYPPHATDLKLPATHLANWLAASREARAEHPLAVDLSIAVESLPQAQLPPAFHDLVDRWRRGEAHGDDRDILQATTNWLRSEHPQPYRLLCSIADQWSVGMRDVLADLAASWGTDRCFLIGAADVDPDDETPGDRYLRLLEAVFERVFAFLRTRPPQGHKIWVRAEGRKIGHELYGSIHIRPIDVGGAVRAAELFPLHPPQAPADPHVRLVPRMPEWKAGEYHPGIVLADFIANQLRGLISTASDWPSLATGARSRTGLESQAHARSFAEAGPLPAIAAQGEAREAIASALRTGRIGELSALGGPAWIRDQTAIWISVVGGGR